MAAALSEHVAAKYSTRWSGGAANEAAPLRSSWEKYREQRLQSQDNLSQLAGEDGQPPVGPHHNIGLAAASARHCE